MVNKLVIPFVKASSRRRRAAAPGQAVVESIFSFIMFCLMLALVMSISMYLYFQHALITAAREGARQASLDTAIGVTATESTGINNVKDYVKTMVKDLTGQTYSDSIATITVKPPSQSAVQTVGKRDVKVYISWNLKNPVGVAKLLNSLTGSSGVFDVIPVTAGATMRYEE